jgi:hypothetical protein
MVFIAQMKTKKESREEKDGVHNVDENQKGEQERDKWCS